MRESIAHQSGERPVRIALVLSVDPYIRSGQKASFQRPTSCYVRLPNLCQRTCMLPLSELPALLELR
jgi:hypothetical protein